MSILCSIGIHNWVREKQEWEKKEKDKGACIEIWREKFNHDKCTKCGKTRKKINKHRTMPRGSKQKERKLVNREWK